VRPPRDRIGPEAYPASNDPATCASELAKPVLYAVLKTLEQRGEVAKEQFPSGRTGYQPHLPAVALSYAPIVAPRTGNHRRLGHSQWPLRLLGAGAQTSDCSFARYRAKREVIRLSLATGFAGVGRAPSLDVARWRSYR
jgi:hypothetical protein